MLKLKVGIVFCLLVSIINGQIFKIDHREPVISERSLLSYGARFNMTSGISITGRNVTRIEDNAFAKFQNLSSLSLDSTNISRITTRSFSGLRRLEFLQIIDSQNLNEIPANVFTELRLLKVLNLAINNISLIYPDSFNGLDTLIDLYLAGNSILNFPREAFRGCRNIRGDMYLIGQKGTRPVRIDPLAFTGNFNLLFIN